MECVSYQLEVDGAALPCCQRMLGPPLVSEYVVHAYRHNLCCNCVGWQRGGNNGFLLGFFLVPILDNDFGEILVRFPSGAYRIAQ